MDQMTSSNFWASSRLARVYHGQGSEQFLHWIPTCMAWCTALWPFCLGENHHVTMFRRQFVYNNKIDKNGL